MPYASKAQQRFMHAKHPTIAARWDKETNFKKLPERKSWVKNAAQKGKRDGR